MTTVSNLCNLLMTGAFIRASPTHAHGVFVMKFEIVFTSETEPELDVLMAFAKQHDLKFVGIIEEEQEEDDRA
jgi:hypothetical protein